jgi:N-acetylglutamate synthase-like GNAT family acetyltransferase
MIHDSDIIREAKWNDIETCAEIADFAFLEESYFYPVENEIRNSLINEVQPGSFYHKYFVYEHVHKIIGFAGLMNTGYDNSIYGLCSCFVHPTFRGMKVGYELTNYRLAVAKHKKAKIIQSTTQKNWHLERFGFVETVHDFENGWNLMQLKM